MKKLIALILALALFASLGVTAWAAESAGTDRGSAPADRAMAATVLWVMAGQPVVDFAPGFEDLDPEETYMRPVRWAASEGIIKGYDAKTFGPDDPVTREQLAVMLYRYAQKHGLGFTGAWYFPLNYADAGEISDWADEAMHWVVMNAEPEDLGDKLLPKAVVTRRDLGKMTTSYINGAGAETAAFHRVQLGTAPYTVLVPDIYAEGEITEELPYAEDIVSYLYNNFTGTEVFIYQFSKAGRPEDAMAYAAREIEEHAAEIVLTGEVRSVEVGGIPTAQYTCQTNYQGTDHTVLVAVIDAGEDFVELALLSDGKSGNFETRSVLNSLEKLAEPAGADLSGLFPGRWMIADLDGKSALTGRKAVYDFVSSEKAYMNASYQPRAELGTQWIDRMEIDVAVSDGKMTLTNTPDEHTKVVEEYTFTAVGADEFTADRRLTITVDGAATLDEETPVRLVRVKDDYSAAVLGTWQGVRTTEKAMYGNVENHHWEFKADGTYVFSMKNPDGQWIPTEDDYSYYFVAGRLLCTRWKNAGEGKEETREWWEIDSIENGVMRWSALCQNDDGSTYTATFEMTKVA